MTACLSVGKFENSIDEDNLKKSLSLTCYPNPFNPLTTVSYNLTSNSLVKLNVFNAQGQAIKNIINDNQTVGVYQYQFKAENLTSGIYYLVLETAEQRLCKKMMLIK